MPPISEKLHERNCQKRGPAPAPPEYLDKEETPGSPLRAHFIFA